MLEYLDLNVLGLRKIIKKHDKQFDLQMGTMYFGSRMGQNSQLVQLYHQVDSRIFIFNDGNQMCCEPRVVLLLLSSPLRATITIIITILKSMTYTLQTIEPTMGMMTYITGGAVCDNRHYQEGIRRSLRSEADPSVRRRSARSGLRG